MFKYLSQTSNLRSELVNALLARIESGDLKPGQRLPTEQVLMESAGVSRTIVREALATLRAKGLITTRQGLGAFVATEPLPRTFSITSADLDSIDEVLRVLELRLGVEAEAASIAAQRRTPSDLAAMEQCLDALDTAIAAGENGAQEDYAFHRAILTATQNPYFTRLFDTFGGAMIPRQWSSHAHMSPAERQRHHSRVRKEHLALFLAIQEGNDKAASKALRNHLDRSARRFALLRQLSPFESG